MTIFYVEKGIEGILSALFFSFTNKIKPDKVVISDTFLPLLGCQVIKILPFKEDSKRVQNALIKYSDVDIIDQLSICLLSNDELAYTYAFNYAYLVLKDRKNIYYDMTNIDVCHFRYTIQQVLFERHRFTGFLRFSETEKGVLYAVCTPDNDIIMLLATHFKSRLNNMPFVIHDEKRNKVAISNGKAIKCMYVDEKTQITLSTKEINLRSLWKDYYNSVNIKERKNLKQQNNFMPIRYRKHMIETHEKTV